MTDKELNGFSVRVTQCSRTALTALTMEIGQTYIRDAVEAIDASDDDNTDSEKLATDYVKAVRCTSQCIDELISSLNLSVAISRDLLVIYQYIKNNLRQLRRKPNKESLLAMGRILSRLQKSFEAVAAQDKTGPMMANTQKVYAGLTYGQGTLNETIDTTNRGFFA